MGTGCSPDPSGTPLDPATGAVLADAADRLADALAADDPCRALLEADALRERALRALEQGEAPDSVVVETARVVDATTAGLTCDADDEAGQDAEDTADEDEDDPADDADDADDDADGTDEPEAQSPASDPADEDDAGGGSGTGGSGGDTEPERGPDGDGPPGQDRGRGSGTPPGHADGQGP